MDDVKTQLANRLKEANNVLVSVTNNPSVDQFAAAIALTLMLNKLGKHATTVFSGTIPSLVEFLQPEKIVEKNTDSLRDFIISLDKSKADKLRYKIEDNFVKIFITPYHSSIGEKDLVFSQGDFNVDVVVGLGVHQREELDQAIIAHGRILHDATVTTINTQPSSNLGSINWSDNKSSSVCEMLVSLTDLLAKQGLLDTQISNALLTGIVAETQRFSNSRTTSLTMSASSKLLASGANQQLVAKQLTPKPAPPPPPPPPPKPTAPAPIPKPAEAPPEKPPVKEGKALPKQLKSEEKPDKKKNEYGVLEINHDDQNNVELVQEEEEEKVAQVSIDEQGTLKTIEPEETKTEDTNKALINNENNNDAPVEASSPAPPPPPPLPPHETPTLPEPDNQIPSPTYVPPPLVPFPPELVNENSPQPSPPTPPPSPPNASNPFSASPQQNVVDESTIGQTNKVLSPPPTDAQLNSDSNGAISDGNFMDSPTNMAESAGMPSSSIPLLSHNESSASSSPQTNQFANTNTQQPVISPPANNQSGLPNLSEVRSAVDNALSASPPNVANQPLASLNSQEVNLNLYPLGSPSNPGQPTANQFMPGNPPDAPGSSIDPKIIPPNTPEVPNNQTAPPVPPPIVPLDNNLPPSFTAL